MTPTRTSPRPYPLTYVCKYCAAVIGVYPVPSHEPATLSVCDRRECREQAAAAYRATCAS